MSSPFDHCCLTIAGSDSGGGAGIQADLKTFAAFNCHGTSAITAVTAQNTQAVSHVSVLPAESIRRQIQAVLEDFEVRAIKLGMLADTDTINAVADALAGIHCPLVLDPVMVASTGARLLDPSAIDCLKQRLLPMATVLTPNIDEASLLLGQRSIDDEQQAGEAGRELLALGPQAVLIKGGHLNGPKVVDQLIESGPIRRFEHPRLALEGHGTGCTLASAIAAGLAHGLELHAACEQAGDYVAGALANGRRAGKGTPTVLDHFWQRPRDR